MSSISEFRPASVNLTTVVSVIVMSLLPLFFRSKDRGVQDIRRSCGLGSADAKAARPNRTAENFAKCMMKKIIKEYFGIGT